MGTVYSNQTQVNDMQHGRHTGRKGQERMKAKKIIPALAIVLLAVVGTLLWFRPKTVILPENCRLMVDTGEESLAEGMWIEDPEQKAQLLELLSAFRIRRYLSQPATDFPPGLALKFGHGPADRVLYRVSDPAVHGNLHRYFHPKALEADGPR